MLQNEDLRLGSWLPHEVFVQLSGWVPDYKANSTPGNLHVAISPQFVAGMTYHAEANLHVYKYLHAFSLATVATQTAIWVGNGRSVPFGCVRSLGIKQGIA